VQEAPLILLIEDRDDDVVILRRSFQQAGVGNPMQVVKDGEEAVAYLSGTGKYAERKEFPLPELVLLDLKLPRLDGFEVLRWIRTQPALSGLRVVVLSSSENIRDVNLAYALGANSFLVKPTNLKDYVELSSFLNDYWFVLSRAPEASRKGADPKSRQKKEVLIRKRDTRRFYAGHAGWVKAKTDALDFERIELAEAVATAERLDGVEIVLVYDHPDCELTVPVAVAGVRRT
jgi:Response regulators consisting of a CheY-like receiver domain and a winged-helix DNA-binding domain